MSVSPSLAEVIALLPCPFCGNKSPFTYISVFTTVLRCRCGAEAGGNISATVMYKREELPEGLKPHSYEPTLLDIKERDGSITHYPDHGYVGVSALAALAHIGAVERWNTRTSAASLRDEGAVLLPIAVVKQAEQVVSEWLTLHGLYVRADDIERYQYAPAIEELCTQLADAIDAATQPAAQERQA